MRSMKNRLATVVAGSLLVAQTLGGLSLSAPEDFGAPAIPDALFQNACVRERAEREAAEAEGREPVDLAAQNVSSWRRQFGGETAYGPMPARFCFFGDRSGSEDPRFDR